MKTVPAIALPSLATPLCAEAGKVSLPRWNSLLRLLQPLVRRPRRLDVRALPDHLKRDIGALDGNDPRGPRP